MILYLDTSSLVKLYLDEEHSDFVRLWADRAEILCTSRVAYPEAMAAVARRWRDGDLADEAFQAIRGALSDQWPDFSSVELDEEVAGDLAVRYALRGFDAIHLAAALEVAAGATDVPSYFSSFDLQLNRAAREAGLEVLDAESAPRAQESPPGATSATTEE